MKNDIDYLPLAMDESNGLFAWHFFGVVGYYASGDALVTDAPDPQKVAREYLETFHADALAEAEKKSEKTLETIA